MKKIALLLFPFLIGFVAINSAKEITISGTVTDPLGNPVSASIHAGKVYAVTTATGHYQINVDEKESFLEFSAIGFNDQKIKIGNRKTINVKMQYGKIDMDKKVIVGNTYDLAKSKQVASPLLQGSVVGISTMPRTDRLYETSTNTEDYDNITENGFRKVSDHPLSTFSIDVDAASYSNVRRYLNNNQLPPAGAVRIEEMINYFKYDYSQPTGKDPFSINTQLSVCPWNTQNQLLLIGLQGKNIPVEHLPASNLVFLIDVSGSMMGENRLPLVKASMKMLVDQLREKDKISVVVYSGQAGLVLPATSGSEKTKIKKAIDALQAGGSTAGGAGIQLAYATSQQNFLEDGNNRVILCTDGDFNVGESSDDALVRLIEKERNKGIFLTVLGYGMGNYKDNKMQQLADKGNGNHAYIDGLNEAKKVLVNEFGGTLFTIAKDVKLQLEFNPEKVAGYRLIGYENRALNNEDFNDDKKDAGELGSGHTVTALYEIIPHGVKSEFLKDIDPLKYHLKKSTKTNAFNDEIVTIKFRYKEPQKGTSELITATVNDKLIELKNTSANFRFAAAVAGFGMVLRDSEFKGNFDFAKVLQLATAAKGNDTDGYQKEFIGLVKKAATISNQLARKDHE